MPQLHFLLILASSVNTQLANRQKMTSSKIQSKQHHWAVTGGNGSSTSPEKCCKRYNSPSPPSWQRFILCLVTCRCVWSWWSALTVTWLCVTQLMVTWSPRAPPFWSWRPETRSHCRWSISTPSWWAKPAPATSSPASWSSPPPEAPDWWRHSIFTDSYSNQTVFFCKHSMHSTFNKDFGGGAAALKTTSVFCFEINHKQCLLYITITSFIQLYRYIFKVHLIQNINEWKPQKNYPTNTAC